MTHARKLMGALLAIIFFPSVVWAQEKSATPATVVIREYEKSRDEQAIIKILDQYPQYLRYESVGLPEGTTEKYINSSTYTTRVLQEDDTTAGFVNFVKIDRKWSFLNFGSLGLVHLMGVDNNYQGKQYGQALLSHAIHSLLDKGLRLITLATKANNEKARKLYEKNGFKLLYQMGDDCFYGANFLNENAPAPTLEEKALTYAMAHPAQAAFGVAALLIGGGYGCYRAIRSLVPQLRFKKI